MEFFDGSCVFGDDLDAAGIARWFDEEGDGYYGLAREQPYAYGYHALNARHGFRHLAGRRFARCLALGCARGDELLPIEEQLGEIIAIEPAEAWWSPRIGRVPATFLKPHPRGDIPLADASVDLITCFSVLHHIPNVTHVLGELARVATLGALCLLREPIHSLGDWRRPRRGLTRNERGLPVAWLEARLVASGFAIERAAACMFPLTSRLAAIARSAAYNSRHLVRIDSWLSALTRRNDHYHRDRPWKKLAPASMFYVLRREAMYSARAAE